jgi:D-alanyl-D-alanine dipeptidase
MLSIDNYRELKAKTPIKECGEPLLEIDSFFLRYSPHPYLDVGAPYNDKSPFFLRKGVLERLHVAQDILQSKKSGYRLKIYDAYRPLSVQKYMIEYDTKRYSKEVAQKFWSPIADDVSLNPPPHSTGGAVDLSIVDSDGIELDMGTKIDKFSKDSYANAIDSENRKLLLDIMSQAGFVQLPTEWWHFSYGDQIWAAQHKTYAKYAIV